MVYSSAITVADLNDLLRPARAGESEAQQKLLRHFTAFIRFCANRFYLTEEDRRDLVQEGRIALFRAMDRYRRRRGPFPPFACLVIRRHINRAAGKIIQRNFVERPADIAEDIRGSAAASPDSLAPEIKVMERERWMEIASSVRKNLTALEIDVLNLFLQGLTYREMSRQLKRPSKSVDNALRRIRSKVKL